MISLVGYIWEKKLINWPRSPLQSDARSGRRFAAGEEKGGRRRGSELGSRGAKPLWEGEWAGAAEELGASIYSGG